MSSMEEFIRSNRELLKDYFDKDGNFDYDAFFTVYDSMDVYNVMNGVVASTNEMFKARKLASYTGSTLSYYRDGNGELNLEEVYSYFDLDGYDGLYAICDGKTLEDLGLPPRTLGDRVPLYPNKKIKMLGKFNGKR